MDVLEDYKKAWDNQPDEKNKFSAKEIYNMAQSKSSSIVKWIFIIGILEFLFWTGINFVIPDNVFKVYDDLNLTQALDIFMVFHTIIIFIFLFIFYKNYKRVSTTDNTKKLMQNILRIRKTVKKYVLYNLAMVLLVSIALNVVLFSDTEKLMKIMNPNNLSVDANQVIIITIVSQVVTLIIMLGLLWLFYKLVYGILLKKLNKNYKELAKLDVSN